MAALTFSMLLLLSGCCLSHEWVEADCTTPKNCVKCETTEGESLGHQWADATCTAPKTCTVCAAIEGQPLEHAFGEEEMQNPDYVNASVQLIKTCVDCGAQEERTGELNQLHDGTVFLMSPEEFSQRFTNMLAEMQDSTAEGQFSFFIDETLAQSPLKLCMQQNVNELVTTPCTLNMSDTNNQPLMTEQAADSNVLWKIHGTAKGKEESRLAMVSLWRTVDPAMTVEVTEEALDLLSSARGRCALTINGILFDLYPRGSHIYDITVSIKRN